MVEAEVGTGPLSLTEVAETLGVHYMTVYRYVRTGRLPAVKHGSEWRVRRSDLARFEAEGHGAGAPGAPGASGAGPRRRTNWSGRLEERLIAGDEGGAWAVIEGALSGGLPVVDVYLKMLGPALVSIGDRWEAGTLTVADEHRATVVAQRLVGRIGPKLTRRGRKRGTIVLAAPPGEAHALPLALFADLLRARGYEVADLGADVPVDSLVTMVASFGRLVGVGLCATTPGNESGIRDDIEALRTATGAPIWLGGRAVCGPDVALALGADGGGLATVAALDAIDRGLAPTT